jgi:SHS family lactate transporter-like MFS transporter
LSGEDDVAELAKRQRRGPTSAQTHVVAAAYLGWTLDAFDFFIMVFVFNDVAKEFGVGRPAVAYAITLTLATRAIGAFLFGRLADRFGRRPTLMADVIAYSVLEFATGFAPTLTWFLVLRALYGVAMGGEWGVGASLTMESIPAAWRGPVSGILQAGYPSGYLLASVLFGLGHSALGWRGMFMVGALPAFLVLYIRRHVPESPDWTEHRERRQHVGLLQVLRTHAKLAIFAIVMMMAFNFFSHGTQDLYVSFLQKEQGLPDSTVSIIAVIYNIGAMLGGLGFGTLSQRIGRRAAIVIACVLSLAAIPLWAFSHTAVMLALGAFLMQVCVQGAWGVVPVHLNELSPPDIRATFPGLTYQIGNFLASYNANIQTGLAASMGGLAWPLAIVAGCSAIVIAVLVALGPEARHVRMGREHVGEALAAD